MIWITFFDRNDLISQRHLQRIIDDMETKKEHYKVEVEHVKKEKEALFSDQGTLERFAREKYLMKKDNEDIFVIVEEEK